MHAETMVLPDVPIARKSRLRHEDARLLVIWKHGTHSHRHVGDLPSFFEPSDVLVLNDTATLPASLTGRVEATGEMVEVRLIFNKDAGHGSYKRWTALIFSGTGNDWQKPTEKRLPPAKMGIGGLIEFSEDFKAKITSRKVVRGRLVDIEFLGDDASILSNILTTGQPIQYSYLRENLAMWDQQTVFSQKPLSSEPPSASFHLTWNILHQLKQRGVKIVTITHAIGISSTGDPFLDRLLPHPERYWIPENTALVINEAVINGNHVVAAGTSVVRALEASALLHDGKVAAESRLTNLKLERGFELQVVKGLLTGMHLPETSHFDLLQSFIPLDILFKACLDAVEKGYLWHEYGDVSLLLT